MDVEGHRYVAEIEDIFPPEPQPTLKRKRSSSNANNSAESYSSGSETPEPPEMHSVGGDLSLTLEESIARDDPLQYTYRIWILEEDNQQENDQASASTTSRRESGRMKEKAKMSSNGQTDAEARAKWTGSYLDTPCALLSYVLITPLIISDLKYLHRRDRLVFSKSILRRFLRECLDRDSSLASPWTVKPAVAERLGIPTEMPDHIRAGVERVRRDEIDKRKRVWEEKEAQAEREGRLTKKMIKEREREAKGKHISSFVSAIG